MSTIKYTTFKFKYMDYKNSLYYEMTETNSPTRNRNRPT